MRSLRDLRAAAMEGAVQRARPKMMTEVVHNLEVVGRGASRRPADRIGLTRRARFFQSSNYLRSICVKWSGTMNAITCILIALQLFAAPLGGACALFAPAEHGRADEVVPASNHPAEACCESMRTGEDCPAGAVQDQRAGEVSIDPGIFLGLLPSGSVFLTVDHGLCAGRGTFGAPAAAGAASLQAQHVRLQI